MKYMGSKRTMLENGLGELLQSESKKADRIVDLFCGAASVSWFAAQQTDSEVLAYDLQSYAVTMAKAVLGRTEPLNVMSLSRDWVQKGQERAQKNSKFPNAKKLDDRQPNAGTWAKLARELCSRQHSGTDTVWSAYGGFYFSPTQAIIFDSLLDCLPSSEPERSTCLAAVIISASQCCASPGHTAQPFGTTRSAGPYLREAWLRDPLIYTRRALASLSAKHARQKGKATVGNALNVANKLNESDLVFVDPPYSGVHYSRFYHVLETIARGGCGDVSGTGRYPAPSERPSSSFSMKSEAPKAVEKLLKGLNNSGCSVIFTFPLEKCSNGLSGEFIEDSAAEYFSITRRNVKSRFSTLGGNNTNRLARQESNELILLLKPR